MDDKKFFEFPQEIGANDAGKKEFISSKENKNHVSLAVTGRAAFFMLPQVKPVAAIVIIAGVCLGGESGFVAGAMSGFISNFFFGQEPWTPWQMFGFGIIGCLSGFLSNRGLLKKARRHCGYLAALA